MKRLKLKNNIDPNFIGAWEIADKKNCNDVIDFFEENQSLHIQGQTSQGVNEVYKKSTDIVIKPNSLNDMKFESLNNFIGNLNECYQDYLSIWPFLDNFASKIDLGPFHIQKYEEGDHFSQIHSERMGLSTSHRLFAWMTYLNDVESGGYTFFKNYDLRIKPEQGKTLIWPAEWTHAHSGEPVTKGIKYIVTGWMHFPLDNA